MSQIELSENPVTNIDKPPTDKASDSPQLKKYEEFERTKMIIILSLAVLYCTVMTIVFRAYAGDRKAFVGTEDEFAKCCTYGLGGTMSDGGCSDTAFNVSDMF